MYAAAACGHPRAGARARNQDIEMGLVVDGRARHGVARRVHGAGELLDGADGVAILRRGAEAVEHRPGQFLAAGVAGAPGARAGAGAGAHVRATRHALDVGAGVGARAPKGDHGGLRTETHDAVHPKADLFSSNTVVAYLIPPRAK